jgi:predicted nucleic acid-binding protein
MSCIHVRYLDASALVKLVIDEGDHKPIRDFFTGNAHFAATSLCMAEALGAIKAKWVHDRITEQEYFAATKQLILDAWSSRIEIDQVDIFSPVGQSKVEALARKHSLDLSDALQLQTIMQGRYSHFKQGSSSVLITADRKLADAAVAENIKVWNCNASLLPNWA